MSYGNFPDIAIFHYWAQYIWFYWYIFYGRRLTSNTCLERISLHRRYAKQYPSYSNMNLLWKPGVGERKDTRWFQTYLNIHKQTIFSKAFLPKFNIFITRVLIFTNIKSVKYFLVSFCNKQVADPRCQILKLVTIYSMPPSSSVNILRSLRYCRAMKHDVSSG